MSLPAPNLDDLRFQRDLVDQARLRIIHYCPEWTDYNLSDPGITLIELFAWMTELIAYRLNQVPEKNYVKFMELLGMKIQSASSARTELTFWLSVSLPISETNTNPVIIPEATQVISMSTADEDSVTFTTDRRLTVVAPKLAQLRRADDFHKDYLSRLGIETFYTFNENEPKPGDTFYLGFDETNDISGHILRLTFTCEATEAVGVKRQDPPWVWEVSMGNDVWQEVALSTRTGEKDTTGGLNNPKGSLVLYLPLGMQPDQLFGRYGMWIRCRIEQRRPEQGMYRESPRVTAVEAHSLGATVPATHAVFVENEFLGHGNGEPAQMFQLEYAPLLALQEGETVEVEENQYGESVFVPWQVVSDFSQSTRYDRHFAINTATGEIGFGPAVRQPDGTVQQYGRIPESGRGIRFTRYRYGGGITGNVPVDSLQSMTSSLAYISRVSNLQRAAGGRDAEDMDELKARTQRELRAQLRAVTSEDYEDLALQATRTVKRVKCNIPQSSSGRLPPGVVEILIVPSVADSLQVGDLSKLYVDDSLTREVHRHLDAYRLLTTTLQIREPNYTGIKVHAEIVPSDYSSPDVVRGRVVEALKQFISPLALTTGSDSNDDLLGANWDGWPFGRNLYVAEIFSLIQRVPGVKHVLDVNLSRRPVVPREELSPDLEMEEADLTPVKQKLVRVRADTLLCSLNHEITIADLSELEEGDG